MVIPATATEKIHYEGELVVVIGKKAKHLAEANAMSCVFGYTIGNDVSERTWQKADRGLWRAKNADTFKPMGPWIETDVDLDAMETIVKVNGKESNRFRTNDMIFGIKPFIVELTKYFTLMARRRDLDGHRRRFARSESRRRGRDRDHRYRHACAIGSSRRIRRKARHEPPHVPRIISSKAWSISVSTTSSPISAPITSP